MKGNWYWAERSEGASFHGPHDTREQAIAEAQGELERDGGFYIGRSHTVEVDADGWDPIEQWACSADDVLYEDALDDWCRKVPKEKLAALSSELTQVFRKHPKEWGEQTEWEVISEPELIPASQEVQ